MEFRIDTASRLPIYRQLFQQLRQRMVSGQLQRTAVLALVYDSNENHARMIFQSLTLPDGTNVPVVLTVEANRLVNKD